MKKFLNLLWIGAIVAIALISSCNDDEGPVNEGPSRLIAQDWVLSEMNVKLEYDFAGIPVDSTFDAVESLDPCDRDDLFRFYEDETMDLFENGITCQGFSDGDLKAQGTWEFKNNNSIFVFSSPQLEIEDELITDPELQEYTVKELSSNRFRLYSDTETSLDFGLGIPIDIKIEVDLIMKPA